MEFDTYFTIILSFYEYIKEIDGKTVPFYTKGLWSITESFNIKLSAISYLKNRALLLVMTVLFSVSGLDF